MDWDPAGTALGFRQRASSRPCWRVARCRRPAGNLQDRGATFAGVMGSDVPRGRLPCAFRIHLTEGACVLQTASGSRGKRAVNPLHQGRLRTRAQRLFPVRRPCFPGQAGATTPAAASGIATPQPVRIARLGPAISPATRFHEGAAKGSCGRPATLRHGPRKPGADLLGGAP